MLSIEMLLRVKFKRAVDGQKDNISPGGYEMIMNGRSVQFDFCTSHADVSQYNPAIVDFTLNDADITAFPDFANVTEDDLNNISSVTDCYVYTGEDEETDLEPVSIKKLSFLIVSPSKVVKIAVPDQVIDAYNERLKTERVVKQMNELKQNPELFAKKAIHKGLDYVSRFLDMPIEDLAERSNDQLIAMIQSIAEQMPEEIFEQFLIGLNGGKRRF